MRKLQTLALTTFSVIGLILMRFNRYRPSTLIRYVCVFFFQPLSRVFSSLCVIDETLSVLVWTEGLNVSKWRRFQTRLRVVPHFSSGIVERAKRWRTFARSAIPEEKWGTTRSLFSNESALVCTGPNLWSTRKRHPWKTQGQPVILKENMFSFATNPVHTIPCIARIHDAGGKT